MNNSNNKTSILVGSQVPQFVRDDHETFVTFLEEYYKFLEQDGQLGYVTKNFLNFLDIDNISEDIKLDILKGEYHQLNEYDDYHIFLQKLYDNFIALIPQKVLADKSLILKHAKDFYRARGSEKSVRFLLRVLFNKEIEFYYPKVDVLKASDGKWYIENALRVSNITVNGTANTDAAINFTSKEIRGVTSNTTAIVEFVDTFFDKGQLVTELKISNFDRPFENNEEIFTYYSENGEVKLLSGTLYSGTITSVSLVDGGVGYIAGSEIPVEGGGGANAKIIVSKVTNGSITSLGISKAGAGFRVQDNIIILGGGGAGANGRVGVVDLTEKYHPNTYQIVADQIFLEANTPIGNTIYANLEPSIIDPANNWIANSMHFWAYANCGPITFAELVNEGLEYSSNPTLDIQSNTAVRSIGILGRMEIINGGLNYTAGDRIEFINPYGSFGTAAQANVVNVAANGMITNVKFEALPGFFVGGEGYSQDLLPVANVVSTTGTGANIAVTAIIADGEQLLTSAATFGTILKIDILSGGDGFTSSPTLNLANMAFGSNGIAKAFIQTGAYVYPGRYLNDDGQVSAYNFLEDRDYYQNYSYVIKVSEPINKYRKAIKDLTHPAGMKLFGQYEFIANNSLNVTTTPEANLSNSKLLLSTYQVNVSDVTKSGSYNVKTLEGSYVPYIGSAAFNVMPSFAATYDSRNNKIYVRSQRHSIKLQDTVYLSFSTNYANIVNGIYTVTMANTNYFSVGIINGNTSLITIPPNTSNLQISTGEGNTVSWINLTHWTANSNVKFSVGDSINVKGNIVSVVYSKSNSSTIAVFPAVSGNIVSNNLIIINVPYNANGNVIVKTPKIKIDYMNNDHMDNSSVYLDFQTSDSTYSNGFYNVVTANSISLTVFHKDIANASILNGRVNVRSNTLIITSNSHNLIEGESIYLTFNTGDLANSINNFYNVYHVTANTFNVDTSKTIMSNGNVSIKTANVTVTITNHGFRTNDSVYMWFTSGDTANISNGYYTVFTKDLNTVFITDLDSTIKANGSVVAYRNFMNTTITRTNHGYSVDDGVRIMMETGNLANIANGIYYVNQVIDSNTYNIKHDKITISGNLNNIFPSNTGYVYVSGI